MKYVYVIERAADGSYSAYVPDLPGCTTCGDTPEEVRRPSATPSRSTSIPSKSTANPCLPPPPPRASSTRRSGRATVPDDNGDTPAE